MKQITMQELKIPSCDGVHTLSGRVYLPETYPAEPPRGLFQVVHGMSEYIGRYDAFMRAMAAEGYVVFGYDHLGHGATAKDASELGYIAEKDGWDLLCRDVKTAYDHVRGLYGDLPYVLMGHSMGSFIVRLAAERYVRPSRLLIMGTGGPNPAAGAGLALVGLIKGLRGDKHVSRLVAGLAMGSYNQRFKEEKDEYAWLSTDASLRDAYRKDPLCGFPFTTSAMGDLIRLTKLCNRSGWFSALPKDLPILLVSGAEDPVGGNGAGVRTVERKLKKAGHRVTCHLYTGARHEILNDLCKEDVIRDIRQFTNQSL